MRPASAAGMLDVPAAAWARTGGRRAFGLPWEATGRRSRRECAAPSVTGWKYLFTGTPSELVGFYPSPPRAADAPVAQGIEQRPPEPCAQVRILPGALKAWERERRFCRVCPPRVS